MRFKPTLTFLVPILSLLASVRAAPSDLQSRDSVPTRPFDIAFAQPTRLQQVKPGSVLTLQFVVTQQDPDPLPPWTVEFWFVLFIAIGFWPLQTDNISPTNLSLGNFSYINLTIPSYVAGLGSIVCYYKDQYAGESELIQVAENITLG